MYAFSRTDIPQRSSKPKTHTLQTVGPAALPSFLFNNLSTFLAGLHTSTNGSAAHLFTLATPGYLLPAVPLRAQVPLRHDEQSSLHQRFFSLSSRNRACSLDGPQSLTEVAMLPAVLLNLISLKFCPILSVWWMLSKLRALYITLEMITSHFANITRPFGLCSLCLSFCFLSQVDSGFFPLVLLPS